MIPKLIRRFDKRPFCGWGIERRDRDLLISTLKSCIEKLRG